MLAIRFKYADEMSGWKWREQSCVVESVKECKELYGLGVDCEYEILSVEEIGRETTTEEVTENYRRGWKE